MRHKLTQAQVRMHFGDRLESAPPELKAALDSFASAVDSTYLDFEKQNNLLQRSMELSALLHGLQTVRPVMKQLLEIISEGSDFPVASLEIYNREKNTLELAGIHPLSRPEFQGMPLAPNELPYRAVIAEKQTLFENDDFKLEEGRSILWADLNIATIVCVPMKTGNLVWGTLTIGHPEIAQLSERRTQWLRTVADQIATVFEREKLNTLNQTQQAFIVTASKMSELGKMAGGVAHEINTPLGTIRLMTETLLEKAQEKLEDKSWAEALATIVKTVDRISAIVKGLRTFSRDGSKDPFVRANLKQTINNTLALCSEKFKQGSVKLIVTCPDSVELACRETQISQVLLNLLSNGYDAIKGQPDPWVSIIVDDYGPGIQISVTDSGKGIPRDMHEKIFIPFFTTKKVGDGTGLGLSICMGIVDAHGGSIELDPSSPNTRFVIFLPKNLDRDAHNQALPS